MYTVSHIFLSGTARSVNQDRHLCGSHQRYIIIQLMSRFALSFKIIARCHFGSVFFGNLLFCRRRVDSLFYLLQEFIWLNRFSYKIACPLLHGFYRTVYFGIACHYDKGSIYIILPQPTE